MKIVYLLGIFLSFPNISFSNEINKERTCNLQSKTYLMEIDFSLLKKTKLILLGLSSEGAEVQIYENNNRLVAIKASFFGEFAKTEINYFFENINQNLYLVEVTDYNYTSPVYIPDSKIASVSINRFIVCEGKKPNYPNSSDLNIVYNRAVEALKTIKKSIKSG